MTSFLPGTNPDGFVPGSIRIFLLLTYLQKQGSFSFKLVTVIIISY